MYSSPPIGRIGSEATKVVSEIVSKVFTVDVPLSKGNFLFLQGSVLLQKQLGWNLQFCLRWIGLQAVPWSNSRNPSTEIYECFSLSAG